MSKVFQGERMTCVMCGRSRMSDPKVESGWTCIEIDKRLFYVCPVCFPTHDHPNFSARMYGILAHVNELLKSGK